MKKKLFPYFNRIRNYVMISRKITGTNNKIDNEGIFKTSSHFVIKGSGNTIRLSKNSKFNKLRIFVSGNNNVIHIDSDCLIKNTELWIEDNDCSIRIGKSTTIESAHLAATENNSSILLGDDCMLAKKITIRTGDSHSIIDLTSMKRINYAQNVTIGNHVWLGENSCILKGVNVGNNVIVGTGSIVTKDCISNALYTGIPAKLIKENVDWKRERI